MVKSNVVTLSSIIKPTTVLFASDDTDASLTDAKEYIKSMGLTKLDVKLIKKQGQILVVAIRGIENVSRMAKD